MLIMKYLKRKFLSLYKELTTIPKMKNSVFISGRVSGITYKRAKLNFDNCEKWFTNRGLHVVNPTKICKKEWSWLHCMIVCIYHLVRCEYVCFLSNYKESRGSRIEYLFAKLFRKKIAFFNCYKTKGNN